MIQRKRGHGRTTRRARKELPEFDCDLPPLKECVRRSLRAYFRNLNGHSSSEVYELVMSEIELPLLEVVLAEVKGNLTRASELLGLNRATLRKKLKKYGLERADARA